MVTSGLNAVVRTPPPRIGRRTCLLLLCASAALVVACSTSHHTNTRNVRDLAPLQMKDRLVRVEEVGDRISTPDLLALDSDMRAFVQRYTENVPGQRAQLMTLHRAIRGSATLGIRYDPEADGSAREAFYRGTANCLSYSSLFIALAREAGLDAGYQWLESSPRWSRSGERVEVRLHVNVSVRLSSREQYMVDIAPLEPRDIAGSQQISDADAQALHHSNVAVNALATGDREEAWLHAVRALQLSPQTAHLWVNLGAIYRANGQHSEAEENYLYALQLDPEDYSAMNNLVVLYGIEGRSQERQYWAQQVAAYREANPYYHIWQGDEAVQEGAWRKAVHNYEKALALAPEDSRLLSALGRGYARLGESEIAAGLIKQAIEAAPTPAEAANFRLQLDTLREGRTAGVD